jgi:hypothetical protein
MLKKPPLIYIAAVLLVLGGPLLLLLGFGRLQSGVYPAAAAGLLQGAVMIVTAVMLFTDHREALLFVRITAVLFTVACIFHGLSVLDIVQIAAVWGFHWMYAGWRKEVAGLKSQAAAGGQQHA